MTERRRVHYSGHVQGVSFRYTTVSIARRYRVAGFVQNLADGRVVVVAEGEAAELDPFLRDVAETMAVYVRDSHVELGPPTGEFSGFGVRY
jgi:acylphosphatase